MKQFLRNLREALLLVIAHDVLNTAKAAAYSGMLMLFPALMVLTALLSLLPDGNTLVGAVRTALEQFLPVDAMNMLRPYVLTSRIRSFQVILSATVLAIFAGLGVMLSLMEGFRRAYRLPRGEWGFWQRRLRALLLVPIILVPLMLASLLLVFGHQIESWMIENSNHEVRHIVVILWRMARWGLALGTSVAVLGALYHFGTQRCEHWAKVAPGAVAATLLWFPGTLAFGWYVTRIADYSMFYGSFGAGIATLVWLYLIAFSTLFGAELNGVHFRDRQKPITASEALATDASLL